jgi:MFS family permease
VWFLGGLGSWFGAFGLQSVIFPWLAAVVLGLPAERLGLVQMALMAPSIVFTLLGGVIADRVDTRRLLYRYHVVAALPPLALAAIVAGGDVSPAVLVGYGLMMGTFSALIVPARDALLSRVAIGWVPRAVAVASAVSLVCQLVGIAMGAAAGSLGAPVLLIAQAAVLIGGAIATARTVTAPPPIAPAEARLTALWNGLAEAWMSERIFPVMVVMLAVGGLFVGSFVVIVPLIARDDYGAGSAGLALFNGCFFGGTVTSILAQIRLAPPRRPGRVIVITLLLGAGVLAAMAVRGPMALLAALCALWGMGAGVVLTQARTIVQMAASEARRGRLLATYQLAITGGAPVGAVAMGYLSGAVGPRSAVLWPAGAMLLVLGFLLARARTCGDSRRCE